MSKITDRLVELRKVMAENKIDGLIITGDDPHISEYLPDHWKMLEYFTGFTGSYAHFAITLDKAALWTDSRYYIQAELQLQGSGITMEKDRIPDAKRNYEWLSENLPKGGVISVDGLTISLNSHLELEAGLERGGFIPMEEIDLTSIVWKDRPEFPKGIAFETDKRYTLYSREEKIDRIREELRRSEATATTLSALDDIAWTLNLRSDDINCTPLLVSYCTITLDKTTLYIKDSKLTQEIKKSLLNSGVEIKDYGQVVQDHAESEEKFIIDGTKLNYRIASKIKYIKLGNSIAERFKGVKDKKELDGMVLAHQLDGVAMVKFIHWLKTNIGKRKITEIEVSHKVTEIREESKEMVSNSFRPIVSYGEHGAIVHYSVDEESSIEIKPEGVLLLDSGGQYLCGTTDVTRTIAVGEVSDQMKRDYTAILKGVIGLSTSTFPTGTDGFRLDSLCRSALWEQGLNFGHGTGHGVGSFLGVHEGPIGIRPDLNTTKLEAGNVLSIEPGIYRENQYGMRIENLASIKESYQNEFGDFLAWETLTLVPLEPTLIDKELLTTKELNWINSYNRKIYETLAPMLESNLKEWLKNETSSL